MLVVGWQWEEVEIERQRWTAALERDVSLLERTRQIGLLAPKLRPEGSGRGASGPVKVLLCC